MTVDETRKAIESILMVADQPVEPSVLAQLLEVPRATIEDLCGQLAEEYQAQGRGFVLARVAGGYRFQSHPELAPYVERFVLDGQTSRLSAAALETLAIVAYKQPISRMQIAAIRGVNVDGVLRTLQQRGYVDELSRDPGPGNAVLFGTTSLFLERVGLDSLDDLPPLADFVPGADVVEALEDGLRPEPLPPTTTEPDRAVEGDGTASADEVAIVEPDRTVEPDGESSPDRTTAAPAEPDGVAPIAPVEPDGVAPVAIEGAGEVIDLTDDMLVVDDDDGGDPVGAGHDVALEGPAAGPAEAEDPGLAAPDDGEDLSADPSEDAAADVDQGGAAPASTQALSSPTAMVRHDPAATTEPAAPFRPTPDHGGAAVETPEDLGLDPSPVPTSPPLSSAPIAEDDPGATSHR